MPDNLLHPWVLRSDTFLGHAKQLLRRDKEEVPVPVPDWLWFVVLFFNWGAKKLRKLLLVSILGLWASLDCFSRMN
jgi:hypothetical protein